MTLPSPIVGDWYLDRNGELFEVVATDDDDHTIEVQHFDGALEEFDNDEWLSLLPQPAQPPEDWTGSLDVEPEDHDEDTALATLPSWIGNGQLDRDEVSGFSEISWH